MEQDHAQFLVMLLREWLTQAFAPLPDDMLRLYIAVIAATENKDGRFPELTAEAWHHRSGVPVKDIEAAFTDLMMLGLIDSEDGKTEYVNFKRLPEIANAADIASSIAAIRRRREG